MPSMQSEFRSHILEANFVQSVQWSAGGGGGVGVGGRLDIKLRLVKNRLMWPVHKVKRKLI